MLRLAKFIKPEFYERKAGKKYKAGDNFLKKHLSISKRKIGRALDKFMESFGEESRRLEEEFCGRLKEIEKELERERERGMFEETEKEEENYKN